MNRPAKIEEIKICKHQVRYLKCAVTVRGVSSHLDHVNICSNFERSFINSSSYIHIFPINELYCRILLKGLAQTSASPL